MKLKEFKVTKVLRTHLAAAALLQFIGCNAQQIQTRESSPFSRMDISGSVRIYYTHSDTAGIKVEASGDDLENVVTSFDSGTLKIHNRGTSRSEVKVYVRGNQLKKLVASGATTFRTSNTLPADSLTMNISGSSDVKAEINAKEIQFLQSGASNVVLNGSSEKLTANLSGASTLKAYGLESRTVSVLTTGAATAKVNASESIKASASGASDIRIKGDPRDISAYTSAAASVTRVKAEAGADSKGRSDTTAYNFNKRRILIVNGDDDDWKRHNHNPGFEHWTGISFAVNGYVSPAGTLALSKQSQYMELNYARSFNIQVNAIEHDFKIIKNYVKLVTGLGIDYHHYTFSNNTNLNADSSFTFGNIDSTGVYSYKKNKLRCTYLQVPLLLEFNTSSNPSKTFHLAVGVIGEYLIGSRTRQRLSQGRNEIAKTRKDSYNLSPFTAKAHVNFGYKGWTVFGEYNLTSLFQANKGPELYPFAAGIRVIPFS